MNQAPKNFLAGAALAEQKHGDVDIRDQSAACERILRICRAGRDEEDVVGKLFDFSGKGLFSLAEAEIDDGVEFGFLKRLGEVIQSAELHGVNDLARVVDAGQHDDLKARLDLAQLLERLQAVDAGHEHVEQNQIRLQAFFHLLQRFFAGGRGFDFVVVHFEQRLDVAQHAGFVINQQDFGGWLHRFFPLLAAAADRLKRNQKRKFAACAGIALDPDLSRPCLVPGGER